MSSALYRGLSGDFNALAQCSKTKAKAIEKAIGALNESNNPQAEIINLLNSLHAEEVKFHNNLMMASQRLQMM